MTGIAERLEPDQGVWVLGAVGDQSSSWRIVICDGGRFAATGCRAEWVVSEQGCPVTLELCGITTFSR
jgi:hypothetical protein